MEKDRNLLIKFNNDRYGFERKIGVEEICKRFSETYIQNHIDFEVLLDPTNYLSVEKHFAKIYEHSKILYDNLPKDIPFAIEARDFNSSTTKISARFNHTCAITISESLIDYIILAPFYLLKLYDLDSQDDVSEDMLERVKMDIWSIIDINSRRKMSIHYKEIDKDIQEHYAVFERSVILQNAILTFIFCHEIAHVANGDPIDKKDEEDLEVEIKADACASRIFGDVLNNIDDFPFFMRFNSFAFRAPLILFDMMDLIKFYDSVILKQEDKPTQSVHGLRKGYLLTNTNINDMRTFEDLEENDYAALVFYTAISDMINVMKSWIFDNRIKIRKSINRLDETSFDARLTQKY